MNQELNNQELNNQEQSINQQLVPRAARLVPHNFITVVDSNTQEKVGSVMNFNHAGMQLLMTQEDLELNDIVELTLVSKSLQKKLQLIKVIAELLWVKKDQSQDRVLAGFYLSTKNFKSKFRLNELIKSLN